MPRNEEANVIYLASKGRRDFGHETKGLRKSFGPIPTYFLCYTHVKTGTEGLQRRGALMGEAPHESALSRVMSDCRDLVSRQYEPEERPE